MYLSDTRTEVVFSETSKEDLVACWLSPDGNIYASLNDSLSQEVPVLVDAV
jgi:hypothetical protein